MPQQIALVRNHHPAICREAVIQHLPRFVEPRLAHGRPQHDGDKAHPVFLRRRRETVFCRVGRTRLVAVAALVEAHEPIRVRQVGHAPAGVDQLVNPDGRILVVARMFRNFAA